MANHIHEQCAVSSNCRMLPMLLFFVLLVHTASFPLKPEVRRPSQYPIVLHGLFDNSGDENGDVMDLKNFNPLKQNQRPNKLTSSYSYRGTQISLRQTMMQEVTSKLLDSINDPQATNLLLAEYKEFLLEPLEDEDCVLVGTCTMANCKSREQKNCKSREQKKSPARLISFFLQFSGTGLYLFSWHASKRALWEVQNLDERETDRMQECSSQTGANDNERLRIELRRCPRSESEFSMIWFHG